MRRLVLAPVMVAALGCGGWKRVGTEPQPRRRPDAHRAAQRPAFYQRLGRLAAGDPLPFVGSWPSSGGRATPSSPSSGSRWRTASLRLPARGQRLRGPVPGRASRSAREGARSVDLAREEVVRVATFQETPRADESVLFQQIFRLVPGDYKRHRHRARRGARPRRAAPTGMYTAPKLGHSIDQRADSGVPGDRAGDPGRSGQPGAQPPRRGRLRRRHAARLHRGLRLHRPDHGAVRGARRAATARSITTRSGSAGAGGREPGDPPRARQRGAGRAAARGRRRRPTRRAPPPWCPSPRPGWSPTTTRCSTCCATSGRTNRLDALRGAPPSSAAGSGASSDATPTPTRARRRTRRSTSTSPGSPWPTSASGTRACPAGAPIGARCSSRWARPTKSLENTPGTGNRVIRWTYSAYRLALYFLDETASAGFASPRARGRNTSG